MNAPKLLTVRQVCERLQVCRMTLWRWRQTGELLPRRFGARGLRYREHDVERLVNRMEVVT